MKFSNVKKEYISTRISELTSGREEQRRQRVYVLHGHKSICMVNLTQLQYDPDAWTGFSQVQRGKLLSRIWNSIFKLIKHAQHSKLETTQKMDSRATEGMEILCKTKHCGLSKGWEKIRLLLAHTVGEQM